MKFEVKWEIIGVKCIEYRYIKTAYRPVTRAVWIQYTGFKIPKKFTKLVVGPKYKYSSNRKGVYCMQYAPDCSYLAVGYTDGTVEVWRVLYLDDNWANSHSEAKWPILSSGAFWNHNWELFKYFSIQAIDVKGDTPKYIKDIKQKKYGNLAATCLRSSNVY